MFAACHSAETARPETPVKVDVVEVKTQPAPQLLRVSGTLRAEHETRLAAGSNGRVVELLVDRGDWVARGAAIARFDDRISSLQAREAEAYKQTLSIQAEGNQSECNSAKQLHDAGAISDLQYEKAKTGCEAQSAALQAASARAGQAKVALIDGVLRAPFAGVVTDRYINQGEFAMAMSPIVALSDSRKVRMDLSIPESKLAGVKKGIEFTFTVPAYPGETFTATVDRVGGVVRPMLRDVVVEAVAPNAKGRLLPGMFATADLPLASTDYPSVPTTAVFVRDNQARVFVVARKRLEERLVQPGLRVGPNLTIQSGLAPGERVVRAPSNNLRNGQPAE